MNYDVIARLSLVRYPDVFPSVGPVYEVALWSFVREDGRTEEVRLRRSSGRSAIDAVALELGRSMQWAPATCGGQPVAIWTSSTVRVGGVR